MHSELDPATYGLTIWDLDREFLTDGLGRTERLPLGDILTSSATPTAGPMGIEYMHIQEPEEKRWIQEQVEGVDPTVDPRSSATSSSGSTPPRPSSSSSASEVRRPEALRLDGAESPSPARRHPRGGRRCRRLARARHGPPGPAQRAGQHRGQVLRPALQGVRGLHRPRDHPGLGRREVPPRPVGQVRQPDRATSIPVELAANPRHLEAVDPVVVGMVRANQDLLDDPGTFSVLPLLLHGDAAFAGQGVVAETLNLSRSRATGSAARST